MLTRGTTPRVGDLARSMAGAFRERVHATLTAGFDGRGDFAMVPPVDPLAFVRQLICDAQKIEAELRYLDLAITRLEIRYGITRPR